MTLKASIAERIGAVPKRTLVVGGLPAFLSQTLAPKLAAWGLKVEWHWPTGRARRVPELPAGCEVVVYFSDMVANPATMVGLLREASRESPGVLIIRTVRKAAIWQRDLAAAGLKLDTNYQLKEPEMPPSLPPSQPLPRPLQVARESAPAPKARTARVLIAEILTLLGELDAELEAEVKARGTAEELIARLEAMAQRAEVAEAKVAILDNLKALLR